MTVEQNQPATTDIRLQKYFIYKVFIEMYKDLLKCKTKYYIFICKHKLNLRHIGLHAAIQKTCIQSLDYGERAQMVTHQCDWPRSEY